MLSLLLSFFLMSDVQVSVCDGEHLVFQKEEQIINAEYFNILFYHEKDRLIACDKLAKAERIDLETEINMENGQPVQVYVFVDGKLLQEILVNEGLAREVLHDPMLKYHNLKEEKDDSMAVFSPIEGVNEVKKGYIVFFYLLFSLILLALFLIM